MNKLSLLFIFLTGCSSIPLLAPSAKVKDTYMVCRGEEIFYDLSIADENTISFRREGVSIGSYPRGDCQKLSRESLK